MLINVSHRTDYNTLLMRYKYYNILINIDSVIYFIDLPDFFKDYSIILLYIPAF